MMTRAASLRAGFPDRRFGTEVDYEYLLRLSRLGPAGFIDFPLLRYRGSAEQMSSDQNLARISRSILSVIDSVLERDPTLRSDREFMRRVATIHLFAANAHAEQARGRAFYHLIQSAARGVVGAETARTLAKLCLPRAALKALRSARRS